MSREDDSFRGLEDEKSRVQSKIVHGSILQYVILVKSHCALLILALVVPLSCYINIITFQITASAEGIRPVTTADANSAACPCPRQRISVGSGLFYVKFCLTR